MMYHKGLYALLLVALAAHTATAGIRCYTCINAASNEECNTNGTIEVCADNQQSCQNEVRLNTPSGFGYLITKRCKQPLACENNQNQNFMPAWDPTQCNLDFNKNSVCRCCCTGDVCNKKELPCSDLQRCPGRGLLEEGTVECTKMNFVGSACVYQCKEGYELEGQRVINCVDNGTDAIWTAAEPQCKPASCMPALGAPKNGQMSCSDGFKVSSTCDFDCSLGYKMIGSSTTKCEANGAWSSPAPSCVRITCGPPQSAPTNGGVVCSARNEYDSVCQFACSGGYYMVGFATTACQLEGIWSSPAPACRRVFCEPRPDQIANGRATCSDGNFYESACSYSCNEGYFLDGATISKCMADFKWNTPEPTCRQITCGQKPRAPQHGSVICSDENLYASVCAFSCGEGYFLSGASTTTCQEDFQWSRNAPTCERIICTGDLTSLENGRVKCTEGSEYGSVCKFTCNDGFFLLGSEFTTCQDDFKWSNAEPVCEAFTCGPVPEKPVNGQRNCSDSNKSFSTCTFTCGDGSQDWESKGETTTTCAFDNFFGDYAWTNEPPCCARRCPPFAQVDLFVVLDSSSSVGLDNWNKTVNFVAGIIKDFAISTNDLLVGVIRYNAVVDTLSEIKIGQYTDKASTTQAILNLPYDGQGTNTGNAIEYVVTNMLTHPGNRPTVQDMVLLVTDGISRDDVKGPGLRLRATGTNVVALGISNQRGGLKQEDILDITNDPAKTVILETGFDGLTPELVTVFIKQICSNPCDRQNQYSDFAAMFGF